MATSKPRKFKLHFNRINMQRGLDTVWTIHLSNKCIPATEVIVTVPINTVYRPKSRQPRAWFEGVGYVHQLKSLGPNVYAIEGQP